jgi:hypothetical protein
MKLKVIVNPHPFTSELSLLIQGNFDINVVIRLIDSSGKVIRIVSGTLKKGDNAMKIDGLQPYRSGNYRLEIKLLNGDLLENIQLVKS